VLPLHTEVFFLKNSKISILGGISKFLELIVFGKFSFKYKVVKLSVNGKPDSTL
jgi:hypothetical protein